jgi:hypothetical protein
LPEDQEFGESQVRAFLLGTSSTEESHDIERRLREDADFRDSVEAIEEELFDDYARGRLSRTDAARFAAKYLNTSEGRARLEFASAFARGGRGRRFPVLKAALATAAVLVVALVSFQAGRRSHPPLMSIDLRPGYAREAQPPQQVEVPSTASIVEFRLYPDKPAGDRAILLTVEEIELLSVPAVALADGGRSMQVPVAVVASGTYIIRLDERGGTIATFVIRVAKK